MLKLRIATWNVGQDLKNKQINIETYKYIKSQIVKYNIDIIAFQESIVESRNLESLSKYISKNTDLKFNRDFLLSPSDTNKNDNAGVSVCSKFKISYNRKYMLKNSNLIYKKSEDITYWQYNKGFNFTSINDIPLTVISGHFFPYHIFNRSALEFKHVYEEFEDVVLNTMNNNKNIVVLGDFNCTNIFELLPRLTQKMTCVFNNTYTSIYNKQLDYILVSKNIKVKKYEVLDDRFDHRLCIVDILIDEESI